MTKIIKQVQVLVTQSFDGCVVGDIAWVDYTPRVQSLINAGVMDVIHESETDPDDAPTAAPPDAGGEAPTDG